MWQTVAVREVDEAAELIESERVRELMYKGRSHQIDEVCLSNLVCFVVFSCQLSSLVTQNVGFTLCNQLFYLPS